MRDRQAVPVQFNPKVDKIFEQVKDATEEVFNVIDARDRDLADLTTHKGWKVFEEQVEAWIERLKAMLDPTTGKSIINLDDDPYEIGLKFLIVSFAISQIQALLKIPRATLQGLDEAEEQSKQSGG